MNNIKTFKELVTKALDNIKLEYKDVIYNIDNPATPGKINPRYLIIKPADNEFTLDDKRELDTEMLHLFYEIFPEGFDYDDYKLIMDYRNEIKVFELKDFFSEGTPETVVDDDIEEKEFSTDDIEIGTKFKVVKDYNYDTYDNFIYDDYGDYEPEEAKKFLDKHPELVKDDMIVFPAGTTFYVNWRHGIAANIKVYNYDNVELPMNLDYLIDDMNDGYVEVDDKTLEG